MNICQSCSMPLEREEEIGTNADGSFNNEYCIYCFKEGAFTDPDVPLDEYLENVEQIMKGMQLPDDLILQAKAIIPTLKRWQNKSPGQTEDR